VRTFFGEVLGYLAASGCALACDITMLWILVQYFRWDSPYAACVSFTGGVVVAYALSVVLVFRERRLESRSLEFAGFAGLGVVGLAINAVIMWVAVRYLGLFYLAAKCIAALFTFSFNFMSRRQLLFVRRRSHARNP
jgi:putative flippase GtrA